MKRTAMGTHSALRRSRYDAPARVPPDKKDQKTATISTEKRGSGSRHAAALVGRTRASDVLHRLRNDIIACTIRPGSKLRFETLRAVYNVSFSTLREGLSHLASESLVIADGQRGFRVAPVSAKELLDLTNARVLIEREVLRLAILRGDEAWRTEVLGAFHRLDRQPDQRSTSPEWAQAHAAFHAAMAASCNSPVLLEIRSNLFDRAHRYRRLAVTFRTYQRSTQNEHRAIMEAAVTSNVALACDLIEQHVRRTSEDIINAGGDLTIIE
jgi:GntR family transcriptional regulator, carbon starvation induced regulator